MKKIALVLVVLMVLAPVSNTLAWEWGSMFGSCCIGPRVGLEMNEGDPIRDIEWVRFCVNLVIGPLGSVIGAIVDNEGAGFGTFLASCCIGPRVGLELKERKIRTAEWILLVPVIGIIPWVIIGCEAGSGQTMQEIDKRENLAR